MTKGISGKDFADFWSIIHGYDARAVADFRNKLRLLCEEAGLIHIAEKRWAGEEYDTEVHGDSDVYTDRFIALIVEEKIRLEKQIREADEKKSKRKR
tara:strand:- start:2034 stop:2324 length:291 start_codon:yes stop_codon:yes gene_type:complete